MLRPTPRESAVAGPDTLTRSGPSCRRDRPARPAWSQFWSHSPLCATVHQRLRRRLPPRSRTVASCGGRRCAVLESAGKNGSGRLRPDRGQYVHEFCGSEVVLARQPIAVFGDASINTRSRVFAAAGATSRPRVGASGGVQAAPWRWWPQPAFRCAHRRAGRDLSWRGPSAVSAPPTAAPARPTQPALPRPAGKHLARSGTAGCSPTAAAARCRLPTGRHPPPGTPLGRDGSQ